MPAPLPPAPGPSVHSTPRKPGSQPALRRQNQQRIIEALQSNGTATQAQLARMTGLSTATVSNIIKGMTGQGLVSTSPTTSSGRRAVAVSLNDNRGVAVGMDFGRRHLRVVLATPGYQVLDEDYTELPAGYTAREGIRTAGELLERLLQRAGVPREVVLGVGVGIPGPLDHRTGFALGGTIHPEWIGFSIREEMEKHLGLPVIIDNDCNLGALAEVTWGPHKNVENLVFLKIGTGIGAGLILGGELFYGSTGITGEIGHTTLIEHGAICRCGNRGCLETVASTRVILDLLGASTGRQLSTGDVVRMALAGDAATLRVIEDVGAAVGRALGSMANLINPEHIVLGGPLTGLGALLVEPVRRGLLRYAIPAVGGATELSVTSLADRAEALGAATQVLHAAA